MIERVVFLLEEPSMQVFLGEHLSRLVPSLNFICIKHDGKNDLERSIPRKMRAFQGAHFVVVRDNDGADCLRTKAQLKSLCSNGGRPDALVRIACQELESWYLGVPGTLAQVYGLPKLAELGGKAKYRDPDRLGNPARELENLVPQYRKLDGARRMGAAMSLAETENSSRSFRVFVQGVRQMVQAMAS